jgi:hypothetical protein
LSLLSEEKNLKNKDMKKWLLLLLITLSYDSLWAQEPLTLKGYIDNDHTYYGENEMIQNRLFVLEKADITPPRNIVFVNLSKESAKRVGQSTILLVPVFKDIYHDFLKCGGEITFEAIAFPNHKALYYTKRRPPPPPPLPGGAGGLPLNIR